MKDFLPCIRIPALALSVSLIVGCASVNPKPFTQYHTAVQEAQSGIDAAMSINYNWTRSGFAEGFASNTNSRFSQIMIQPGAGYDWAIAAQPLYLQIKETRSGLATLNTAFATYADLLTKLAGGQLVDTARFDQMAADLNKNSRTAAEALSLEAPSQGFSLFSTAASKAAHLYIENRRQKHLKAALQDNQENVEAYSAQCVSLIHTIRGTIKTHYAERVEPIKMRWAAAGTDKRLKATEMMLALNEQYADAMHILQELETAYGALPQAHLDLIDAIEKPGFDLDGIQTLYASGRRLQRLYDQLEKPEAR